MGRQKDKRQVVVYLPEAVHRRLKLRAARAGSSMSAIVESALRGVLEGGRPVRTLSAAESDLSPCAAALVAHGAPLLGRGHSDRSLEEAVALGVKESRDHPALLRALIVVLARHPEVRWPAVRRRLARGDLPALGAIADLAGAASGHSSHSRYAERVFREIGSLPRPEPFFRMPSLARYAMAASQRTPDAMRRWGFLCATPIADFVAAVRRFP